MAGQEAVGRLNAHALLTSNKTTFVEAPLARRVSCMARRSSALGDPPSTLRSAASDRATSGGQTQFAFSLQRTCRQATGIGGIPELDLREGKFCAALFSNICNSLILKGTDVRVVEGARLENDSGDA